MSKEYFICQSRRKLVTPATIQKHYLIYNEEANSKIVIPHPRRLTTRRSWGDSCIAGIRHRDPLFGQILFDLCCQELFTVSIGYRANERVPPMNLRMNLRLLFFLNIGVNLSTAALRNVAPNNLLSKDANQALMVIFIPPCSIIAKTNGRRMSMDASVSSLNCSSFNPRKARRNSFELILCALLTTNWWNVSRGGGVGSSFSALSGPTTRFLSIN